MVSGEIVGIGINGLGRIGRLVLRRMLDPDQRNSPESVQIKAINSVYPAKTIAHLLKYDSIHGKYRADIRAEAQTIIINGQQINVSYERDPARIPWKSGGVQVVVDASGKFNDREGALQHIQSGAGKVIVTAPGKGMDFTAVIGVNDNDYQPERHHLISTASCTTNCVAPVLHILDQRFGICGGWVTSVHAYTNDQNHLDNPHADLRRARSCTESIVPTTTGIGNALGDVLPHLSDCINGLSLRVPVRDVSLADMTLTLKRPASKEEIKHAFITSSLMNRYIDFIEEPLVSVDFIGSSHSAIIDGLSLSCSGNQVKVLAWYDNEWGYACRVADMVRLVGNSQFISAKVG